MASSQEQKKPPRQWGIKQYWLLLLALVGIVLLVFGDRLPQLSGGGSQAAEEGVTRDEETLYAHRLREEIEQLCESVAGAGQVQVALSFEGGFSYLYATDREARRDGTGSEQTSDQYITVGSGAAESAVLLTKSPPSIRGIGVVCSGGGSPRVRAEIISLLSATYDIGANRIYVTEGEGK